MIADALPHFDRPCNGCGEPYIPAGPDEWLCRTCREAERREKFDSALAEMRCLTCGTETIERLWRSPSFDLDSPCWSRTTKANAVPPGGWNVDSRFDCLPCAETLDRAAKEKARAELLRAERYEALESLYFTVPKRSLDIDTLDVYAALDATRADAAAEVCAWLDGLSPGAPATLIVWGGKGTGKTTLAYATACQLLLDGTVQSVEWVKVGSALRAASRGAKELNVRMAPLMVLDDLGVQKVTPTTTDLVTDLIERRYDHGGLTIVTTNYSLQELAKQLCVRDDPNTGGRLADRLRHDAKYVHLTGVSLRASTPS